MYMRGVFCVLFVVLIVDLSASAVAVDWELTGTLEPDGQAHTLSANLVQKISDLDLEFGADLCIHSSSHFKLNTEWELQAPVWSKITLMANHNREHVTSPDRFRLINKNNYSEQTYFFGLETDQLQTGFLRDIPLKNLDLVDALYLASEFDLGLAKLKTLQLKYAGRCESGSAQVLEGEAQFGPWKSGLALGYQLDSAGQGSEGVVLDLKYEKNQHSANFTWQKIESGFLSPLARSNRCTPNRVGWHVQMNVPIQDLDLDFNLRRQTNLEKTREYPQLSFTLDNKSKHTSVKWRLEPTPAFVIRYAREDTLWQVDALNLTLRYDGKFSGASWSIRFHGARSIGRIELRLDYSLKWRLIGKYDFLQQRAHYSCLVRRDWKQGYIQLEIGDYDGGNITSGFNNPFSFCLSWGWKF